MRGHPRDLTTASGSLNLAVTTLSDNQRPFGIIGRLGSYMFHPTMPVCTQKIKSQAVFLRLNYSDELSPE